MQDGDRSARDLLFERSYRDLREIAGRLMVRERSSHTLGATGLLHEAIIGPLQSLSTVIHGRAQFYNIAAATMKRILIDHGRRRRTLKRTVVGMLHFATFDAVDARRLDLLDAIDRLRELDPGVAGVVEMRHILGMTLEEVAAGTARPYRQVRDDWDFGRAWLRRKLDG